MKRSTFVALFVFVLTAEVCICSGAAAEVDIKPEDRWYILEMQGQRSGWMHESVRAEGGNVKTDSTMRLSIKRGEIGMSIRVESSFVETPDGKPVSMKNVMQLGALPTTTEYTFREDGVEVRSAVGKNTPLADKGKQPLPEGAWMTPRAAERYTAERLAAGDKKVTVRTVDATMGLKAISATHELLEKTNLDVVGKTVPALKWKSTTDAYPDLTSVDYTDERGAALRTETDIGGMKLTVVLSDKDVALAKLDPPELLVSTLIKPDKPIDGARTLKRAVYILRTTGDAMPEIPSTGPQKFDRIDGKSGRLTVDLGAPLVAPEVELKDQAFVNCSNMISCDEAEVRDLVPVALAEAKVAADAPAAARAEALRAFVHRYINKKNLGVGFASAAEVAKTRSGDCSEHGVLLCALMRVAKIPARVVSGVVYVDGFAGETAVFGYHMWAQALIEHDGKPAWVDFDAALSATESSDATHIALAPSALGDDDTTNALVKLVPLIGTLRIEVEAAK